MPRGVYVRTDATKQSLSIAAKKRGFPGVQGYCPPCEEDCTCKKHTTHAGGAKVGHFVSEETRAKIAAANRISNFKGDEVTYHTVHWRLQKELGKASTRLCVDCDGAADDWSYNHQDENQKVENGLVYSTDLSFYEPRCKSCHVYFDRRY